MEFELLTSDSYWLERKQYITADIFAFFCLWKLLSQTNLYSKESHPDFGTSFYFDNCNEFLCCMKVDLALEEFSTGALLGDIDWGQIFPVTLRRSIERNIFWNLRFEKRTNSNSSNMSMLFIFNFTFEDHWNIFDWYNYSVISYLGWKLHTSTDLTWFNNCFVITMYVLKDDRNLVICMIQQTILDRKYYVYEHK